MEIRPFSPDDINHICRVDRQVFGENAWPRRELCEYLRAPPQEALFWRFPARHGSPAE